MSDEEQVELTMEHNEKLGWRVVHFPHEHMDEVKLLRLTKAELVGMIKQMNTNGRACEEVVQSQAETIEKLQHDFRSKHLELKEEIDTRQAWVERCGLLQESFTAVINVMAGDDDE